MDKAALNGMSNQQFAKWIIAVGKRGRPDTDHARRIASTDRTKGGSAGLEARAANSSIT
jgi:hypothetical protein